MNQRHAAPRGPGRRRLLTAGGGLLTALAAGSFLATGPMGRAGQSGLRQASGKDGGTPGTGSAPVTRPPAPGWMPGAVRMPLAVNFDLGEREGQSGLVLHVQEGEGSLHEQFSVPGAKASAHFWVAQDGLTEQYVSVHDRAWGQRAGNGAWSSVETSGFKARPLTEAQLDAVARIYTWGVEAHGWPLAVSDRPDQPGLGTHEMGGVPWGNHACPGSLRTAQRTEIVRRAAAAAAVAGGPGRRP